MSAKLSILISIIVTSLLVGCNHSTQETNAYREYLNSCERKSLDYRIVIDSLNRFKVSIPATWSFQKIVDEDFKGVLAADTSQLFRNDSLIMISFNEFPIDGGFIEYVKNEEALMKSDSVTFLKDLTYSENEVHLVNNNVNSLGRELTDINIYRQIKSGRVFLITLSVNRTKHPKKAVCKYWPILNSVHYFSSIPTAYTYTEVFTKSIKEDSM